MYNKFMDQDPKPKPIDINELRKRAHIKQFIKVINDVIDSEDTKESESYSEQDSGLIKSVHLVDPTKPDVHIRFRVEARSDVDPGEYLIEAPDDFVFPGYEMQLWNNVDEEWSAETPYGPLPNKTVDTKGNIWLFSVGYIFDDLGNSRKVLVSGVTRKEDTSYTLELEDAEHLPKIDLDIEDYTVVKELTPQDFEKLGHFFDEIKRGNIRPDFNEKTP